MSLADHDRDPALEWLDHVQPTGLVVAPALLKELILTPLPQRATDTAEAARFIDPDQDRPALPDFWHFATDVLGWEERLVAGSPSGPEVPAELVVRLPEHDTTLRPDLAVAGRDTEHSWQLLVSLVPAGVEPDARGALAGWEATAHQRFERLLRDTGIFSGLLVSDRELRLVHAPRGETSGWIVFPLRPLATVAGRSMLGGMKLMLDRARLFTDATDRRLPALLKRSRDAQAAVSNALAGQVLGALHELLRGLDAADGGRVRKLAVERPDHLYEGLLAVMMRLVFVLYAEDRDLLPSLTDARARELYERNYSLRGLYAKLTEDAALNPDTMDGRYGGWGRLLALFRLVHDGHETGFVQRRGGRLFDPDAHPFLEGRDGAGDPPRVLPVSDGCVLRLLHDLMTVEARGRGRERLSYRTLDVEQIGSVYETVMGFTVVPASKAALAIKAGKSNRVPVYVDLAELCALKGKERIKCLKEAGRAQISSGMVRDIEAARTIGDLAAAFGSIIDERGSPHGRLTAEGAPILQPTDERRRTGSHYTPRSLTEPIVRHALEPAFARLGEDAAPEAVLNLKVCDPAMGSGAFLVEACRQMGARLVVAWRRHGSLPALPPDEDEDLHARRLVAQRCLYGVDRNARAVDLAKLSMWLATLARDHEFTFLDHALREGDSLVGMTRAQIAATHWDASKPPTLVGGLVADHLREAEAARAEIREKAEWESEAALQSRLAGIEVKLAAARLVGDALVAAFFAGKKEKERAKQIVMLQKAVLGDFGSRRWLETVAPLSASLCAGEHQIRPFHWEVEFPEVFSRESPGFDAIIGNPPFAGKNTTIGGNRDGYLFWLQLIHEGAHGNADLVAHFFRRAFSLLRQGGTFGLIATNTIGQGDTRDTGLAAILSAGGTVLRATRRLKWPGNASVVVSVIHVGRFATNSAMIDGQEVRRISAYLVEGDLDTSPSRLVSNVGKVYQGSIILGMGFTFDDTASAKGEAESIEVMRNLIRNDQRNAERIFPYIGGEEVNKSFDHSGHRFVIDFSDFPLRRSGDLASWLNATEKTHEEWLETGIVPLDYPGAVAEDWPDLIGIIRKRVMPERMKIKDTAGKKYWWRFLRRRNKLYDSIKKIDKVLVTLRVKEEHAVTFLTSRAVYANTLYIFSHSTMAAYAALQNRTHEVWIRKFSSTLEERATYSTTDCYDPFPFPEYFENNIDMEQAGRKYDNYRISLMADTREGMSAIYRRFHDHEDQSPGISILRDLHFEMDRAVLRAYGWIDLAKCAEPIFLNESNEDDHTYQGRMFWPSYFRDEVLARLLALNAERAAAERAAGLTIAPEDDEEEAA